ncbi:MAG TPA: hypothetical protein VGL72_11455 [Bryobacteraceae bacterium]|jgi:hypothetical protein
MSIYSTRVELHGASRSDYGPLHKAMKLAGFSQTVTSDDGTVYELPEAEYVMFGSFTSEAVCAAAETATKGVWSSYSIFTNDGTRWASRALKVVT